MSSQVKCRRTVAVFHHLPEITGPPLSLERRLECLADAGWEVTSYVQGGESSPVGELYRRIGRVEPLDVQPLRHPLGFGEGVRLTTGLAHQGLEVRQLFNKTHPDVVVVTSALVPVPVIVARLCSTPVLLYLGEIAGGTGDQGRIALRRAVVRFTTAASSHVIGCSGLAVAQLPPAIRRKATVMWPDVVVSAEENVPPRSVDHSPFRIVTLGAITSGRGQDVAIRAAALLRAQGAEFSWSFVGETLGSETDRRFRTSLDLLRQSLGVTAITDFPGSTSDTSAVYRSADLVVNPARFPEPFGRVGVEAALHQVPFVASGVGFIPELFRHGSTAMLVPPDDPDHLAAVIKQMIESPVLRRTIAEAAYTDIKKRLRHQTDPTRFRALVESLIKPGS